MAFAIMATDSKRLYLIFHDHRTKKEERLWMSFLSFLSYLDVLILIALDFNLFSFFNLYLAPNEVYSI